MWGSSAERIWGVGTHGFIFKWDGTQWLPEVHATIENLRGVWGVAPATFGWWVMAASY